MLELLVVTVSRCKIPLRIDQSTNGLNRFRAAVIRLKLTGFCRKAVAYVAGKVLQVVKGDITMLTR